MALQDDGVLTQEELERLPGVPSRKALAAGPVAVIECAEEIPCNPCERVCPRDAITVGEPITKLPVLDEEECDGCLACIAPCPGLAIFVVDETYSDDEATVSIPYEFVPLPEKGERVDALNRRGEVVAEGTVVGVRNPKAFDRTAVVTVAVPKELSMEVRHIRVRGR